MDRDMFRDMMSSEWLVNKTKSNDYYAQNLYAAMCNVRWQPNEVITILKDEYWSCSWRRSGRIVADLLGKGDYMDWYCSGMGGFSALADETDNDAKELFDRLGYVPEGEITDEIREDLFKLGWTPSEWPDN